MSVLSRTRQFGKERLESSQKKLQVSTFSNVQFIEKASPIVKKQSSNASQSNYSSKSQYMCVNCINHDLSSHKKQMQTRQKLQGSRLERSHFMQIERDIAEHQQHWREDQKKKALEVNRKLIDEHNRSKEKIYQDKQRQKIEIAQKNRQEDEKAFQDRERQNQYKHKWMIELEKQIQIKNEERKYQTLKNSRQSKDLIAVDLSKIIESKKQMEERYRVGLQNQIKEHQFLKKKEKLAEQKHQEQNFGAVKAAIERQEKMKKTQNERKIKLLEEARRINQTRQYKKRQQRENIERERVKLMSELNERQNEMKEKLKDKQVQVKYYLEDIKKQIDYKKSQRERQRRLQNTSAYDSYMLDEPIVKKKNCRSCDKKFPKNLLTKMHH